MRYLGLSSHDRLLLRPRRQVYHTGSESTRGEAAGQRAEDAGTASGMRQTLLTTCWKYSTRFSHLITQLYAPQFLNKDRVHPDNTSMLYKYYTSIHIYLLVFPIIKRVCSTLLRWLNLHRLHPSGTFSACIVVTKVIFTIQTSSSKFMCFF